MYTKEEYKIEAHKCWRVWQALAAGFVAGESDNEVCLSIFRIQRKISNLVADTPRCAKPINKLIRKLLEAASMPSTGVCVDGTTCRS